MLTPCYSQYGSVDPNFCCQQVSFIRDEIAQDLTEIKEDRYYKLRRPSVRANISGLILDLVAKTTKLGC